MKPVILIDLSAVFHQAYAVNPDEGAYTNSLAKIQKLEGTYGDALVAVCCDGRGNWRKALSPEYKAQREKLAESFYGLFDRLKGELKRRRYLLWEFEGFEADDVIATATQEAIEAGHRVTIATSDKDLSQLLCASVNMFKLHTWEYFSELDLLGKFGVEPHQFADWLALVGDTSDNVKGAPGVGPKKASALLEKHGNLDAVIAAAVASETDGAAITKSIRENSEQIRLARKLVALSYDVPLNFEEIYQEATLPEQPTIDVPSDPVAAPAVPFTSQPVAPSVALVPSGTPFELQLQPTTPNDAIALSQRLLNSGLYPWLRNADTVLAVISRGREVGLAAGAALDTFKLVEGRLCPGWQFIVDRAERDPMCEFLYCSDSTPTSATVRIKHRRNPTEQTLTYTLEEARAAGLVKPKGAWEKYPGPMCRKMALVHGARMVFPGATASLYAIEEMEHS
jgi:5'-3' exonuclease